MSKTKILIILGAVAGLILVVGLAVGLTYQSKTSIENDISDLEETISAKNEVDNSLPSSTTSTTTLTTFISTTLLLPRTTILSTILSTTLTTTPTTTTSTTLSLKENWGQWSEWTTCSQYCRQARMLRFKFD